jgi:hypothetical protein
LALKRLPHLDLELFVREHLSVSEDAGTALLSQKLQRARRRGYLTSGELEAVCRWKSARAIRYIRANSHHRVRAATQAALATRSESARLLALLQLQGVSVPMASALLTLVDPRRYGVIDIRVWQLLHAVGAVSENRRGVGFSLEQWLQFLAVLRGLSAKLGVTARTSNARCSTCTGPIRKRRCTSLGPAVRIAHAGGLP